ncbi:MAG TPA: hypothetical protein VN259_17225 [Xanthomonadales bacterium]|nr:hypothetical protein [Xanthomonadales bacterium]
MIEASLHVTTSAGERCCIARCHTDEQTNVLSHAGSPLGAIGLFEVEVCHRTGPQTQAPFLTFVAPNAPSRARHGAAEMELWASQLLRDVLRPSVKAIFRPQIWDNDYAVDLDDRTEFDCLPELLRMSAQEVRAMFNRGVDFDRLANGLPAREHHGGPFEVEVDEQRLVSLINSLAAEPREISAVEEVSDHEWTRFVQRVSVVLGESGVAQQRNQRPSRAIREELEQAKALIGTLYAALSDASSVVDASEGEQYAYQAELESAEAFLGIARAQEPSRNLEPAGADTTMRARVRHRS